jgi:hypothetical protein
MEHNYPPGMTEFWTPIRYNPDIHPYFINREGEVVLRAEMVQLRVRHGKVICFGLGVVTE